MAPWFRQDNHTVKEVKDSMDIEEAMAKVALLDFTALKRKLETTEGWSAESVAEAEQLYRRYLSLAVVYPDQALGPSREIDDFWHAHILDTRAYMADCEMLFGKYMHHFPYGGESGSALDAAICNAAYAQTCELFRRHFDIVL